MNIIFLDIDGVMNHGNYCVRSDKHFSFEFCPRSTENLKKIIEECDAKIVVSSTWRIGETVESLRNDIFSHYGLDKYVIGVTPIFYEEIRGNEIKAYLENAEHEVTNFVILDDDKDMGELIGYLVQTSDRWGLTDEVRDKAIKILKG